MQLLWVLVTSFLAYSLSTTPIQEGDDVPVDSSISIGKFLHIVVGEMLFIDLQDKVLLKTDLRNLFPESKNQSRYSIKVGIFQCFI